MLRALEIITKILMMIPLLPIAIRGLKASYQVIKEWIYGGRDKGND